MCLPLCCGHPTLPSKWVTNCQEGLGGPRAQAPCPGCRPAPRPRLMAAQPLPPKAAGHGPAWAAAAASRGAWGRSLGLQTCTLGPVPTLARRLSRQSAPQQPPSPAALAGGSPWAQGPESGQTTARGGTAPASDSHPGRGWAVLTKGLGHQPLKRAFSSTGLQRGHKLRKK